MSSASNHPDRLYWQRKLAAFLHDSPSKPLDIQSHGERAKAALKRAGLIDQDGLKAWFDHGSDHLAAAADRLPFPHWCSGMSCKYDPEHNPFRHPMGADAPLKDDRYRLTTSGAEEIEQSHQPEKLLTGYSEDSAEHWRSQFLAHWRLWRLRAVEAHAGFASLPADTRIPDHTIWTHMGVVSALEGCNGEPALLKFQLGPVQDFIAAARSTRDLWSGSYLLSWLMAAGLSRLALSLGPDAVIFPNLWGQPLIDLHLKNEIWDKLRVNETADPAWKAHFSYPMSAGKENGSEALPLHTPNLPNVFLALVPASRAAEIARDVQSAIKEEWTAICKNVLEFAEPLFGVEDPAVAPDAAERFETTVKRHLDIAWQTYRLPETPRELFQISRKLFPADAEGETPIADVLHRVDVLEKWATQHLSEEDRDGRYYIGGKDGPKEKLNSLGVTWSLAVTLAGWQLDGVRSLRVFHGTPGNGRGNEVGSHGAKDALNGRDPMLFGGSSEWRDKVQALPSPKNGTWKKLFRHTDEVGAITLVKRLWHLAYLQEKWEIKPHPMPNTHELAIGQTNRDDDSSIEEISEADGKYFAVLAFDGDSIGQWVSGAKTPPFSTQVADPGEGGPRRYFDQLDENITEAGERLLPLQRPLSPSYHLQFSEALSNFALHLAPKVVAGYGGKLLYAGGDDVLAMLPAPHALACAHDLQRVFRGLSPSESELKIYECSPGFLTIQKDSECGRAIPLIVPGPRATASAGLAIAHFKQPLQDVVREAMAAEKRAKKIDKGKHALGVTLMKRSGETIHWDTRFDEDPHTRGSDDPQTGNAWRGGPAAVQWLLFAMGCRVGSVPNCTRQGGDEVLSRRFPHRLADLLAPYAQGGKDVAGLDAEQLFEKELNHTLSQQKGKGKNSAHAKETIKGVRDALLSHFQNLPASAGITRRFQAMLDLLATAAFLARQPEIKP